MMTHVGIVRPTLGSITAVDYANIVTLEVIYLKKNIGFITKLTKLKIHAAHRAWAKRTGFWAAFYIRHKDTLLSRTTKYKHDIEYGGNYDKVFIRDQGCCTRCGISAEEHYAKYASSLATRYKVTRSTIERAVRGTTWRDISGK